MPSATASSSFSYLPTATAGGNPATFLEILKEPVEFVQQSTTSSGSLAGDDETIKKRGWILVNPETEGRKDADDFTKQPVASTSTLPTPPTSSVVRPQTAAKTSDARSLYTQPIVLALPSGMARNVASGLNNIGMTCYMNSTLQALVHTPGLQSILKHHRQQCDKKMTGRGTDFCGMCKMNAVCEHSFTRDKPYTPTVFTKCLRDIGKFLRDGRQEDAHEFLRLLIDKLQDGALSLFPNPKNISEQLKRTTSVHQLFGGELRSRVMCSKCENPSDTFDATLDLSIETRNVHSVREGLKKFIAYDRLEGQNKYKCEKCKVLVNATKQMTVHEAPKILVVHLKRFGITGGKLTHPIEYEEQLDLNPYMSKGQLGAKYRLYAIILHHGGGAHSGHYTAVVKSTQSKWYHADDEEMSPIGKNPPLNRRDAYMLFYVREKGELLEKVINGAVGKGTTHISMPSRSVDDLPDQKTKVLKAKAASGDDEEEDVGVDATPNTTSPLMPSSFNPPTPPSTPPATVVNTPLQPRMNQSPSKRKDPLAPEADEEEDIDIMRQPRHHSKNNKKRRLSNELPHPIVPNYRNATDATRSNVNDLRGNIKNGHPSGFNNSTKHGQRDQRHGGDHRFQPYPGTQRRSEFGHRDHGKKEKMVVLID